MKTLRKWAKTCLCDVTWQQLALIALGTAVLSFSVHNIHQRAGVTEGGVIGMILLLHHHLGWSAALLSPLLDLICYGLAWRQLGVGFIRLSVFSTLSLAGFYRLWELFPPLLPDLSAHPLWAAVLGGVLVGLGAGLVVSQGGSCGGDDALALSIARVTRRRLSAAYLVTDLTVLGLSLTYIPWQRIIYSLVTVLISSPLIDLVQSAFAKRKETASRESGAQSPVDIPPVSD